MDIHESLQDVLRRPKDRFGDLFYKLLMERCPEVQGHFRAANLRDQATLLMNALQVVVANSTHSYPATAAYLKIMGNRHYRRGIGKDLYPKFRDALLAALGQFHGTDWSADLHQAWQTAIDRASEDMFCGYVEDQLHI